MVLVFDKDLNPVSGDPRQVSRESQMHFACYRSLPEVNGVIHAHARYLSVFAATGEALAPTNEYTEKFGVVEVIPALPSHSGELADAVVASLIPRRDTLKKNGLGLILAWHGAVTVGSDLADAYDVLDRLEPTDAITLHWRGAESVHPSQRAVPVFDDNNSYYNAANPMGSVIVPQTGTQIRIQSVSAQGGFMQVQVRPSP